VRAPFSTVMAPPTPAERSRRRGLAVLVVVAGLVLAGVSVAGARTTAGDGARAKRVVTVYSVATGLQYINAADDSARGKVNNPLDSVARKLHPKGSTSGDGPAAGDIAVYSVDLYGDATLKRRTGTGVYTCYFNYNQHALCRAYYKHGSAGTLVASGPVDFNASGFTIVLTGGTKTYLGARGEVIVASAKNRSEAARKKGAQKVDFELLR
jgi:hypothetical protein